MPTNRLSDLFRSSAHELAKPRSLVMLAMLLALRLLLDMVISIPIGPSIRVSFGYLMLATSGALFGPIPGMISGALADVLLSVIRPTGPYFPGFTLTGLVSGALYGLMLYQREPILLKRILLTKLLVDVVCNLILNTLWLNILYGKAFFVLLPPRLVKNALQYLVDVPLLYAMLRQLPRLKRTASLH